MYNNTHLAISVTVAATNNSCYKYITEKRGALNRLESNKLVNNNYSRVNNFWEHDRFNQIIEELIKTLDKLDGLKQEMRK